MSLYDFYMYLKYIEFSPENLEFFIWYVFSANETQSSPARGPLTLKKVPELRSDMGQDHQRRGGEG